MTALRSYVGDAAKISGSNGDEITEKDSTAFVTLPGKPSAPFNAVVRDDSRWFEVFFGDDNIDVITRTQDPLLNAVAKGFADCCARFWEAELDE